jgi:long-subunit fatty acid transport protein
MRLKDKTVVFFLLGVVPYLCNAQQIGMGSWNIVSVKYNFNDEVSAFGEGQVRSLKFYDNFHYYEYKGGVGYSFSKSLNFTMGAGSYQTYSEKGNFGLPKKNDEIRLWPQISLFQRLGRFKIEQRYRTEFRFTSDGYKNRFRYRFGISYPFGKEMEGFKPYQLSISNEIFFTDRIPYFERVRLSTAFNYRLSKRITFQIGYIYQFDYKLTDETGRDFFQLGLFFEISKRKRSEARSTEININDN